MVVSFRREWSHAEPSAPIAIGGSVCLTPGARPAGREDHRTADRKAQHPSPHGDERQHGHDQCRDPLGGREPDVPRVRNAQHVETEAHREVQAGERDEIESDRPAAAMRPIASAAGNTNAIASRYASLARRSSSRARAAKNSSAPPRPPSRPPNELMSSQTRTISHGSSRSLCGKYRRTEKRCAPTMPPTSIHPPRR
jgi:hypothetical protein